MNNVEIWLWILLVMLPHNPKTAELLKTYGSAVETAKAIRDGKPDSLSQQEKNRAERVRTRDVREIIEMCGKHGIRIITLDDEEYPSLLRQIDNPPIVLFVLGTLKPLNLAPSVAVVGTRSFSEYSRKVCSAVCGDLANDGINIVSGLAVGCDATAHRAAVDYGGYTVGVMGCGVMVNYPAENEELKRAILEKGGAIVSELLPPASVSASYFKIRNRIIAGMAMGTLVIEAATRSGSLLTAEHTFKQQKPVFVIPPHDVFEERYCGAFGLIRNGAVPISCGKDIFEYVSQKYQSEQQLGYSYTQSKAKKAAADIKRESVDSAPTSAETPEPPPKKVDLSALNPEYLEIAKQLTEKPMTMDELITATDISHDEICTILLDMELDDIIFRSQEGTYLLN